MIRAIALSRISCGIGLSGYHRRTVVAAFYCPQPTCNACWEASGPAEFLASLRCRYCESHLRRDTAPAIRLTADSAESRLLLEVSGPAPACGDGFTPSRRRAPHPPSPLAQLGGAGSEVSRFLFKLWQYCDANPEELGLVAELCLLYASRGVIDTGAVCALHEQCPRAGQCWSRLGPGQWPSPEYAGVSVPWIGTKFSGDRVLSIGLNLNAYGGLPAVWWNRREAIKQLRLGKRVNFNYRWGCALAVVRASLNGENVPDEPLAPDAAADGWLNSAFTEMVKCSPRRRRSLPTAAMTENCPATYLADEVRLLRPRAVVLMGQQAGARFRALYGYRESDVRGTNFGRGTADIAGRKVQVLRCAHPSAYPRSWVPSYEALIESLRERPLSG
jgi:Uracil DNA glycosylase superfamily